MMELVKRFERNAAGRDLIVGDIHGHFTKVVEHLDRIGFDYEQDRLFSVGDLVDRGPESADVLFWLAQPWFHAVQGNHEDMAVSWDQGGLTAGHYAANGGAWNIANDPVRRRDIALAFQALPVAIELETSSGLVGIVHADCPAPSWQQFAGSLESPLTSEFERGHLVSMAQWSRNRCDYLMADGVAGVRAVVVGHTPMERMSSLGNVLFIDTGGWLGREFCVIDAETLQPARRGGNV